LHFTLRAPSPHFYLLLLSLSSSHPSHVLWVFLAILGLLVLVVVLVLLLVLQLLLVVVVLLMVGVLIVVLQF